MAPHLSDEEVLRAALVIAASMVDGTVSPHAGAAQVWALSSENGQAYFDELRAFIAAASQYDEAVEHRLALAGDALLAARELLARHRGYVPL